MVYRHKTSPTPRKFEVIASARKALSTIFWDMKGVVHMEFLKQGHTVNSEKYISTLRTLKVDSGGFAVVETQYCSMTMHAHTQVVKLKMP